MYPEMQLNKFTFFLSLAVNCSAPFNVFFCPVWRHTHVWVCICVYINALCVCSWHTRPIFYFIFFVLTWPLRPLESRVLIFKSSHAWCLANCAPSAHAHTITHTDTHRHTRAPTHCVSYSLPHTHTHIPTWDYIHSSQRSSISVGQAVSTLLCVIFTRLL